jgi:hypothetical protein
VYRSLITETPDAETYETDADFPPTDTATADSWEDDA